MAKRVVVSPWLIPNSTIGFPQTPSMPPQLIRPLHVWGHPSSGNHVQTHSNMWSKHFMSHHFSPPPPPPPPHLQTHPIWTQPPRPVTYGPSQGMPLFPPPVSGIPHHALYKNNPNAAIAGHPTPSPLCSTPSNERIDAAFEDVLAKPWLPLPIGLKSPAIEIVVGELQRQGVPQIPPSS